jgi:hypothetical protein
MELEGTLQCSREPATGPCPEPRESIPHSPKYVLILFFHLYLDLQSDPFFNILQEKCWNFSFPSGRATEVVGVGGMIILKCVSYKCIYKYVLYSSGSG